ncbi:hypothetical protein F4703DRAFT_1198731 [Phycomyces blakesleeanus]
MYMYIFDSIKESLICMCVRVYVCMFKSDLSSSSLLLLFVLLYLVVVVVVIIIMVVIIMMEVVVVVVVLFVLVFGFRVCNVCVCKVC